MRYVYTFLFYLALPFILLRLIWRSFRQPAYRERIGERFGHCPFHLEKSIWLHAVSVGETLAAVPLVKALQSRYPHLPILITTMTPTGADCVRKTFANHVYHAYLPYDLPSAMQRFVRTLRPIICIIMETELWPNLLDTCRKSQVPVCLVNARLSQRAARRYQKIAGLTKAMLQKLDFIAANHTSDAQRLVQLGAPQEKTIVTGNIKFDIRLPADLFDQCKALRESLGKSRFIWIAASTHEGEEEILLAAHEQIRKNNPSALLILVPRHPARFERIATLSTQRFVTMRRSSHRPCTYDTAVYLGDTMGELLLLYGAADVAFVAGSLVPHGGHNVLEAAVLGKPILTGPHVFNFTDICEQLLQAHALVQVNDAFALARQMDLLLQQPMLRQQMGKNALQVMAENRGALTQQVELISQRINLLEEKEA